MRALTTWLIVVLTRHSVRGWALGKDDKVDIFDPASPYLARWSMGENTSSTDGLRGGIAWAVEPSWCNNMLSRFPEETTMHDGWPWNIGAMPTVLDCDELLITLRRTFSAWQGANSNLRFFEVTSLCDGKWQWPNATNSSSASTPTDAGGVGAQCEHAELVIGTYTPLMGQPGSSSTVRTLLTTVRQSRR